MDRIKYPTKATEAEIQSTLWAKLREQGLDARLQVIGTLSNRRHKFDMVVFRDQVPQSIIECKSWSGRYSKERLYQLSKNTKQIRKYERYGVPVFVCGRPEQIQTVLTRVLSSYHTRNYEHTPLEEC